MYSTGEKMQVIVEITGEQLKEIEQIIRSGKCPSIETFIQLSIANQIYIEKKSQKGAKLLSPTTPLITREKKEIVLGREYSQDTRLFSLTKVPSENIKIVDQSDQKLDNFPFWGQNNRLFCIKPILRSLSRLLASRNSNWIEYDEFCREAIIDALQLQNILEKDDEKQGRARGLTFATSLPTNDAKSMSRFQLQYIGYVRPKDGKLTGLLPMLRFINIKKNEKTGTMMIGITKEGLEFTQIDSPIIDQFVAQGKTVTQPLSTEEVNYLLKHISKYCSHEYNFMSDFLQAVDKGTVTPTSLLDHVRTYFHTNYKRDFTEAVIGTMRAGMTSRLLEMGLLSLQKEGLKSSYKLTDSGKKYSHL